VDDTPDDTPDGPLDGPLGGTRDGTHDVAGEGLSEPLPDRTRRLLQQAVRELVAVEAGRVFPPLLHVGRPGTGAPWLDLDTTGPTDPGLRADVVAALRARAGADRDQLVWLTRPGPQELQDVDALWLAAARAAYTEAEAPLTFVVVTRQGWRDPRSGVGQRWTRLRPASSAPRRWPGGDSAPAPGHPQVCTGSLVCISSR
jgi:hypothetical protein